MITGVGSSFGGHLRHGPAATESAGSCCGIGGINQEAARLNLAASLRSSQTIRFVAAAPYGTRNESGKRVLLTRSLTHASIRPISS